jgi:uncharacterized protein YndB with AHSA1/START domain
MADPSDAPIEVEVTVDAPAGRVWRVVSDIARMGEWSPECRKVVIWSRRGVRAGSWFTGFNRRRWVVWPTSSKVVVYETERSIAWQTWESGARWIYELEPVGEQTRLVERRELPDGMTRIARFFARAALGGVESHNDELRAGLLTTLQRIKAEAERQ